MSGDFGCVGREHPNLCSLYKEEGKEEKVLINQGTIMGVTFSPLFTLARILWAE